MRHLPPMSSSRDAEGPVRARAGAVEPRRAARGRGRAEDLRARRDGGNAMSRKPLDRGALEAPPAAAGRRRRQGDQGADPDHRRQPRGARRGAARGDRGDARRRGQAAASPPSKASPPQLGIAMPEAMVVGAARSDATAASRRRRSSAIGEQAGEGRRGRRRARAWRKARPAQRLADAARLRARALALDAALLHSLEPLPTTKRVDAIADPAAPCRRTGVAARLRRGGGRARSARLRPRAPPSAIARWCWSRASTSHVVTPDGERLDLRRRRAGLGVRAAATCSPGIVGGLLARGAEPLTALLWAVWLHGEAGASAREKVGPIGFLAREIADEIPALTAALRLLLAVVAVELVADQPDDVEHVGRARRCRTGCRP